MELRDFIAIIARYRTAAAAGLILGITLGSYFAWRDASVYRGSFTLSVYRQDNPAFSGEKFAYDGYYIVEASRLFGERLGDYLAAYMDSSEFSRREGSSAYITRVARLSPQDVSVTVAASDARAAQEAAEELRHAADTHIRELALASQEAFLFRVSASDVLPRGIRPWYLFLLTGAILGTAFGYTAGFLRDYCKISRTSHSRIRLW